jgi:hypothetical protein
MAADSRSPEEIRQQLSAEREQLVGALADLKQGVHDARRIPIIAGGALAAGLAAFAAVKFVRGRGD